MNYKKNKNTKLGLAIGLTASLLTAFTSLHAANVAPSQQPPAGIEVNKAPMFLAIAFDDNSLINNGTPDQATLGGQAWSVDLWGKLRNPAGNGNLDTHDGQALHTTFFNTCSYILSSQWDASFIKASWHNAMIAGHEMSNHTMDHLWGGTWMDTNVWGQQIGDCNQAMSKPFNPDEDSSAPDDNYGIGAPAAIGFRTPYLDYNAAMFETLQTLGFRYDASIGEGYQWDQDGTNFFWPYTMDNGSPGADLAASWGTKPSINQYPGLWEVPVYAMIVPSDERAADYGLDYSLRDKLAQVVSWFDPASGKIDSGDYNFYYQYKLNKNEALAVLKYSLDLHLAGNRAPMTFLAHSEYYADIFDTWVPTVTVAAERREVMEEFLAYALSKSEVRVASHRELIDWMEKPVALGTEHCYRESWTTEQAYVAGDKIVYQGTLWEASWWSYNTHPAEGEWKPWVKVMECE